MAISEETRHGIYEALRGAHGDEVANGLMELLPALGWADVATKHDLAHLEERIDLRFQLVTKEFELAREEVAGVEARLGERLERALRGQSARFTASLFAALTLFGVVDRLIG